MNPLPKPYSHVDDFGEPAIPFGAYIHPENDENAASIADSCSFKFLALPFDIQVGVYQACDPPTLFQLMHTSRATRWEAQRVFFAHQTPWYYMDGTWLIVETGQPGTQPHCPEFANRIQQIELEFWQLGSLLFKEGQHPPPMLQFLNCKSDALMHKWKLTSGKQIEELWEAIKKNFPALKRVVITENVPSLNSGTSIMDKELQSAANVYLELMAACPNGIEPFLGVTRFGSHEGNGYRDLFAYGRDNGGEWSMAESPWVRDRIALPHKPFRGIAGRCQQIKWAIEKLDHRFRGIRELRLQTYEWYHFDGPEVIPFDCPRKKNGVVCYARFTAKSNWTKHAKELGHDQIHENEGSPPRNFFTSATVPLDVEQPLLRMEEKAQEGWRQQQIEAKALFKECISHEDTMNPHAEKEWKTQMETDPLYLHKCTGSPCSVFNEYRNTYGYQAGLTQFIA
jgi:hypothetical protein